MTTPEPTVAAALANAMTTLTGLGAMQAALQDEPARLDLIVNRDVLTGRTKIHGYLEGRRVAHAEVRFNPDEPRLHLHVVDSGTANESRPHAWAQTVEGAPGAPEPVAQHLAELAREYHRPHRGCEHCGVHGDLPTAPQWTVVLDEHAEIAQIRQGVLSKAEARAIGDAGNAVFVVWAYSLPSAHERAVAVLDDLLDHGTDIPDHHLVDSEATTGSGH
ncbi:hypothetical protein [Kitasatospora sp. NPDC058478]|uniref:hypothetical protein n=1 Tax=unclassified Kitasatospora TaxID=2633591 RepID=UPI0036468D60